MSIYISHSSPHDRVQPVGSGWSDIKRCNSVRRHPGKIGIYSMIFFCPPPSTTREIPCHEFPARRVSDLATIMQVLCSVGTI